MSSIFVKTLQTGDGGDITLKKTVNMMNMHLTETLDDLNLRLCTESGDCCETVVNNDGSNLQQGVTTEVTSTDLGNCEHFLASGGLLTIMVTKPGEDGWWGEYIL